MREDLLRVSNSRTAAASSVQRAKILLLYGDGKRISDIVRDMGVTRPLAERCIDKALTFGPIQALRDLPRTGHPTIIGDDAKAWVLSVACQKPTTLGYAQETWTYSSLIKHLRQHCQEQGHPLVRDRHRSREFVEFLTLLDEKYPQEWKIRLVLDNHSSYISKETQAYLRSRPERFEFVFTPKHGSWLNLIEVFFSKLARSILRHIRVDSKQELVNRIYRGIEEFNKEPVIFRWRYKMDEVTSA